MSSQKNARKYIYVIFTVSMVMMILSFQQGENNNQYISDYFSKLHAFEVAQKELIALTSQSDLSSPIAIEKIRQKIANTRCKLKAVDFWLRYLDPIAHKKINGPLPVEWETEVFEKFEKPYKREGAGLTLALQYLDEEHVEKAILLNLLQQSEAATRSFQSDSISNNLKTFDHFFLCNRLFLLNLATIYTTGFECPDVSKVIPELTSMLADVNGFYQNFNKAYPRANLSEAYLDLYKQCLGFVKQQPQDYASFNHFVFIRDYVNPLFALNHQMIVKYHVSSHSNVDYSLDKTATSIFSKTLYRGQNPKGIFLHVESKSDLEEMNRIGKLLFYDPILSANNMRSCASCHKPEQYLTDTSQPTNLSFDGSSSLTRNTPTLLNAQYNHLIMLDGKHISLQHQTKAVITNQTEMASDEKEMVQKVMSCDTYRKSFLSLLKYTPQETVITADHIASVITYYYSRFSQYNSAFDDAMNKKVEPEQEVQKGYNLFMSKAQCATCHFAPQFNGVKPPYVSSEFEVLGVPQDKGYKSLSTDKGRYRVNPAHETLGAFRTGTLRNIEHTAPYMHNGVFKSLDEVIEFYNVGGGAGSGLAVPNQTLSADSLRLTSLEKRYLLAFLRSLTENIIFEKAPAKLPASVNTTWNKRKVAGVY